MRLTWCLFAENHVFVHSQSVFDQLVSLRQLEAKMLQVLAEEEHLDESRVAKSLSNLSSAFDEGIETYVLIESYTKYSNGTYT